jgi:hypothetical protein
MPDPVETPSLSAADIAAAAALPEDLPELFALVQAMDHAQNAQLEATNLLRDEVAALHGLLAHLIQILTPDQPEPEGPSLRELLARVIRHQSETAALLKQTLAATARIETRLGGETTPAAPTLS